MHTIVTNLHSLTLSSFVIYLQIRFYLNFFCKNETRRDSPIYTANKCLLLYASEWFFRLISLAPFPRNRAIEKQKPRSKRNEEVIPTFFKSRETRVEIHTEKNAVTKHWFYNFPYNERYRILRYP